MDRSQEPTILPGDWAALLKDTLDWPRFRHTLEQAEAAEGPVYPPRGAWFAALSHTPPARVRAVILGQDPYHGPGQAMGLAFSVASGVKLPPSLRNIYRELESDLGCPPPPDGDLTFWADQGVLLLNTVLTVRAGAPNSHREFGWQALTGAVIASVSRLPQPVVFVLWGAPARRAFEQATGKALPLEGGRPAGPAEGGPDACPGSGDAPGPRLVLTAPHPSPLSAYRGFFGSRPFSQINDFLLANGEAPIRWTRRTENQEVL